MDSDHALVCDNLTLHFSGQKIHRPKWIDVSKLTSASVATKYQTELGNNNNNNNNNNKQSSFYEKKHTKKTTS
ncbi:unnamed protein product [Schistosoma mattheei]|uniref:Uncharacterized protein n=1 Tax=Schistosoma mattheei TaxID=31246 RepID=A0A183NWS3_9TREM|nr:unnamed protein product [Schistosoma mattheei]